MKKLSLLLIATFALISCQGYNHIVKDPKARYVVANNSLAFLADRLTDLRVSKIISNDNDWNNVKKVLTTANNAFREWDKVITTGEDVDAVELAANVALQEVQKYLDEYEAKEKAELDKVEFR